MSFLDGVTHHLATYAQDEHTDPDDVHVRFTLSDGSLLFVRGPRIDLHQPGVALIRGAPGTKSEALVIREDHVWKVQFQPAPTEQSSIGYHAELNH